jgi:hypothetical protein
MNNNTISLYILLSAASESMFCLNCHEKEVGEYIVQAISLHLLYYLACIKRKEHPMPCFMHAKHLILLSFNYPFHQV